MVRNTSIARLISASALAFAAASLLLPQSASALPLRSDGSGLFGFTHNGVAVVVEFENAAWTPNSTNGAIPDNPEPRSVNLATSSATCKFTDTQFNRDDSSLDAEKTVSISCSLNFTIKLPTSGSGGISCNKDVQTFKAYCEPSQFAINSDGFTAGMKGALSVGATAGDVATVLAHAGCGTPGSGCSWPLGSLPEKNGSLDTSKFGCARAFPGKPASAGGDNTVDLAVGQLMLYSETFKGPSRSGNCTTGTREPTSKGIRMCFGEEGAASPFDCQRHFTGNNTIFHTLNQNNDGYDFTLGNGGHIESSLQVAGCPNGGTTRFIIYGEDQFDVHTVTGDIVAGKLGSGAATTAISTQFTDDNGDGKDDLIARFAQCDLGVTGADGNVDIGIQGYAGTLHWNTKVNIDANH